MSVNSVVMCVAASYRTLKRGAVNFRNTFFIYLSLLCQVLARIMSFLMLYLYQRRFYPAVGNICICWKSLIVFTQIPVIIVVHFLCVGILKWIFERARVTKRSFLYNLVGFINIFASSFVYVRIVPIEKPDASNRWTVAPQITHTTFVTQSLFFLLILLENLLLAFIPIVLHDGDACCVPLTALSTTFLGKFMVLHHAFKSVSLGIFTFCLLSWIFHTAYYKYYGHPWADINGPDITTRSMTVRLFFKNQHLWFM